MPIVVRYSDDILSYKGIDEIISPTSINHESKMGLNKIFKDLYSKYNLDEKFMWLLQHQLPYPTTGSIYSFHFKDLPNITYIITKYENKEYYTAEKLIIALKSLKLWFLDNPSRSVCVMPLLSSNIKTMKKSKVLDLHYEYLHDLPITIFISQYPSGDIPIYLNIVTEENFVDMKRIDKLLEENNIVPTNIILPILRIEKKYTEKYKDKIINILINKRHRENTMARYTDMITDLCDVFIFDNFNNLNNEKRLIRDIIKDNKSKKLYLLEGENINEIT